MIAPRNLPVRPTTDFAKEALFNLLQNYIDISASEVLDLFAGTGNISYEFASRDSRSILAVDSHAACVRYIAQTAEKLQFNTLQAVKADALQFVNRTYKKWDIIFADPPYDYTEHLTLIDTILDKKLLQPDGVLVIEHGKKVQFSNHPNIFDSRKYGNVHFSFFAAELQN